VRRREERMAGNDLDRQRTRWEALARGRVTRQTWTAGAPSEPLQCAQRLAQACREAAPDRSAALEPTLASLEALVLALDSSPTQSLAGEAALRVRGEILALLDTLEMLMDAVLLAPTLHPPVVGRPGAVRSPDAQVKP
jgi:hypothetical protein